MDRPLNCEPITTGVEQLEHGKDIAQGLDKGGGPAELIVPSTATWSEGISPSKEGTWVGY